MDDIKFKLLLSIITLLCTIITSFVIPYLKSKISSERLAQYKTWADLAVRSAEMLWSESGQGSTKKEYAMNIMKDILNKYGFKLTDEQISMVIEASVKSLKIEES